MLVVPYSFVESAENACRFGQSIVYLPVDLGVWFNGTPQIIELMNYFLLNSNDVKRAVGGNLLRVQAGEEPHSSSSWPRIQRAGQVL